MIMNDLNEIHQKLAPILVFVYSKLNETKATLEALMNNGLSKNSDLYIFSDGYKDERSREKVEAVRNYIHSSQIYDSFKNVQIYEAEKNKGLAASIISGVTKIIEKYGRVIVVEDDLVTSPCYLEYMNKALEFYENDSRVWSVTGFSFEMKSTQGSNENVFIHKRACSYGWGTWKNRWDSVDWNVADYHKKKNNLSYRCRINKWGTDLTSMLDQQILYGCDSWAIRWCVSAICQNKYTVYPTKPMVKIVALGGEAVHGDAASNCSDEDMLRQLPPDFKLSFPDYSRKIRREFNSKFDDDIVYMIRRSIKWFLIRHKMGHLNAEKRFSFGK